MNWFRSLLGGSPSTPPPQPSRTFPYLADVGEGGLRVTVHKHDLPHRGTTLPCWTFASEGLERRGQREVVISLVRTPEEEPNRFPQAVLDFFAALEKQAVTGKVADPGSITELGAEGFAGKPALSCIAWMPAQPLEGVPISPRAMMALLLTKEERDLAKRTGLQRVLSRLGLAARSFPFPPYLDRSREPVAKADELEATLLGKVPVCGGPGMCTWIDQKTVTLAILPEGVTFLRGQLAALPPNAAIAIATQVPPDLRAAFVWHPGQSQATAVQAEGRTDPRIGGSFFALSPGPETAGRVVEDGFVFVFKEGDWERVRDAIVTGKPISFPAGTAGDALALEVRIGVGPAEGAPGAGGGVKRVMMAKLTLKTPEAEVEAKLGSPALSQFLNALANAMAQGAIPMLGATQAAGMVAKVTLNPTGEPDLLVVPSALGASYDVRSEAERRIRAIPAPPVKGPVSFEVEFSLPPPGAVPPGVVPPAGTVPPPS